MREVILNQSIVSDVARIHLYFILCDDSLHFVFSLNSLHLFRHTSGLFFSDYIVKKTQKRLYFLRQLRKSNLPQELLQQFYSAVIESVLCTSIAVWFGSATKSDIRRLQRTVQTAERIIGAPLPTLQELCTSRLRKRSQEITLTSKSSPF